MFCHHLFAALAIIRLPTAFTQCRYSRACVLIPPSPLSLSLVTVHAPSAANIYPKGTNNDLLHVGSGAINYYKKATTNLNPTTTNTTWGYHRQLFHSWSCERRLVSCCCCSVVFPGLYPSCDEVDADSSCTLAVFLCVRLYVCHRHQQSGVRQPLVTSAWRSLDHCLLPSASLA